MGKLKTVTQIIAAIQALDATADDLAELMAAIEEKAKKNKGPTTNLGGGPGPGPDPIGGP